ncbi:heat-inducible transcriptional repressor HrcA [bacterium]|nr:heat-inducible transcriptional repressor HrcA [bacterium]
MIKKTVGVNREADILKAAIHSYIDTAEPIASQKLVKTYKLNISSATVRNVLVKLEEQGYLIQPHTSAGRVPTDKGYRFYVKFLIETELLTSEERNFIDDAYSSINYDIESIIKETTKMLSFITNYMGFAELPRFHDSGTFKHLELIALQGHRIMIIIIMNSGDMKKKVVCFRDEVSGADLQRICAFLNENLEGLDFTHIRSDFKEIFKEKSFHLDKIIYNCVLSILDVILSFEEEKKVFIDGYEYLMQYPEFRDINKAQAVFKALNARYLSKILNMPIDSKECIKVLIGRETADSDIENCSLLTVRYSLFRSPMGSLGIIGPRRMAYSKVISKLNYTACKLSDIMKKLLLE